MTISMILVGALGLVAGGYGLPFPDPDSPVYYGGFQPVEGARGLQDFAASGGGGGGGGGGYNGVDAKTIYVNVPQQPAPPPPKPIAAGPPRKHYKIVFIRAPAPAPLPQPILPPRTEQKTIIYVLHQKQEPQQQNVINVAPVKHSPEVYFVQYDNPPTAEELQQLSSGDLSSFGVSQSYGSPDSAGLGSVASGVQVNVPPGSAGGFDVRGGPVGVPLAAAANSLSGIAPRTVNAVVNQDDLNRVARQSSRIFNRNESERKN